MDCESIAAIIDAANKFSDDPKTDPDPPEWSDPEPLCEDDGPEPFPLDALPGTMAAAVAEYQAYGQQPLEMVAIAALSAVAGAAQGLVDVRRDSQLVGPVSLNTMVIADSGERKTSCDNAFSAAAERWSRDETKRIAPMLAEIKEERDALAAEKAGLLAALKDASGKVGKLKGADRTKAEADVAQLKQDLAEKGKQLPPLPPQPAPRVENASAEGVAAVLRNAWPSTMWASSEGAAVTGGHAYRDDALLRTFAFGNSAWDGSPMDRARSTEDYTKVYGRRLTVALMLQPAAFAAFASAGGGLARGLGSLARMLVAHPASTMGTRFRDPDATEQELPALGAFLDRAEALYRTPLPMPFDMDSMSPGTDEKGRPLTDQIELSPVELKLSDPARRLWIGYQNQVEAELVPEGELATVRDVAAKSAENACRLAALFHVWERGPAGEIGAATMANAIVLARWFLHEARRVLGGSADRMRAEDAELLARWVKTHKDQHEGAWPTIKDALRLAPYRLRKRARRDEALELLIERHWACKATVDRRTVIELNPALGWEE
jgi:putative DNA primase/helicase